MIAADHVIMPPPKNIVRSVQDLIKKPLYCPVQSLGSRKPAINKSVKSNLGKSKIPQRIKGRIHKKQPEKAAHNIDGSLQNTENIAGEGTGNGIQPAKDNTYYRLKLNGTRTLETIEETIEESPEEAKVPDQNNKKSSLQPLRLLDKLRKVAEKKTPLKRPFSVSFNSEDSPEHFDSKKKFKSPYEARACTLKKTTRVSVMVFEAKTPCAAVKKHTEDYCSAETPLAQLCANRNVLSPSEKGVEMIMKGDDGELDDFLSPITRKIFKAAEIKQRGITKPMELLKKKLNDPFN